MNSKTAISNLSMKIKYHVFLLLAMLGAIVITFIYSTTVIAQEEPTGITGVTLRIYPEFDNPFSLGGSPLLIILQGDVDSVDPPVKIRFLVPQTALMYSAGSIVNGTYTGGPPIREPSDLLGWDEISYELVSNTFRVEYYDPNIIIGQPDKTIDYEFRPLYPINDLTVIIQEPLSSSDFNVSIGAGNSLLGTEYIGEKEVEFRYHNYTYNDLSAEDSIDFQITYTKSDTRPSWIIAENESNSSNIAAIVGGILGGIILIAVIVFFVLKYRSKRMAKLKHHMNGNERSDQMSKKKRLNAQFCSKCGKPIRGSDRFCPNCGTKRG